MPKVETSLNPWGDNLNSTYQNYVSKITGITMNQTKKLIRFKRDLEISTDDITTTTNRTQRIVKKLIRVEPIYNLPVSKSTLNYFNANDYLNLFTRQDKYVDKSDEYVGQPSNVPPKSFYRKRVIKKKLKYVPPIEPTVQDSSKRRKVIVTRKRIIQPSYMDSAITEIKPTRKTVVRTIKHTILPISTIESIKNSNIGENTIINNSPFIDDLEDDLIGETTTPEQINTTEVDNDLYEEEAEETSEEELIQNLYDYEPFFPELSETLDSPVLLLKTTVLSSIEYQTKTQVQSKLRTYTFVVTRVNGNEQIVTSTTEVKPHTKTIVVTESLTRYTTLTLLDLDATETLPLLPMTVIPSMDSSIHSNIQDDEKGRGFEEGRYNLATRIMSNGVEVIVAGDKSTLPGEPDVKRVLPSSIYKPITLRPSTLTNNMMMMLPQEAFKIESLSSSLYPNQFVTKTCLTTFTYLTTYLENGTTTVSSHEQVVSNVATEERNTGKILPTPTMGITLTQYPNLAVGTFLTTYMYLNTILDGEQPLVVTSKRVVTNTVTAPNDYLSLFQSDVNASVVKDTNTYYSTISLKKTLYEGKVSKVVSTNEVVTQVVITESVPPQGTSVMTSYIALDFEDNESKSDYSTTDVVKTYFVTYTYYNTVVDGDKTSINVNVSTSSDLVTEKIFLHPKRTKGDKTVTKSVINTDPIVKEVKNKSKLEADIGDLNIFATKTYLTTFTYFTTLLHEDQAITSTVISSHSRIVENVVTETIEATLLDKKYFNALKKHIKEGGSSIVELATLKDGQKIEITAVSKEKIKPTKVLPISKTQMRNDVKDTMSEIEPSNPNIVTGSTIIFVDENEDPFAIATTKTTPPLSKKIFKTQSKNALNSLLSSEIVKKPERVNSKRKPTSKRSTSKSTSTSKSAIQASQVPSSQHASKVDESVKSPIHKLNVVSATSSPVSGLLGSINMNNLQKLAPVLNAMAGFIQTNLKSRRNESITTTPKIITVPLENDINPAVDIQNRSPIYIPVGDLTDIETAESQNIANINIPNTWEDKKIVKDQVVVGKATHESQLLNGGISISPGEIITTNSDVIVGKQGRVGPRIPSIPISNPSNYVGINQREDGFLLDMRPPPETHKSWPKRHSDSLSAGSLVIHAPNKDDYVGPPPPEIVAKPSELNEHVHIPLNSLHQERHSSQGHAGNQKQIRNQDFIRNQDHNQKHSNRNRNNNKNNYSPNNGERFHQQSIPINEQFYNKYATNSDFNTPTKQEHRPVRNNNEGVFFVPEENYANNAKQQFDNMLPSIFKNEPLGNPEVIERSTGQPLLVHIQPSQVAFVNIPHNRTTALIYGGSTEPHINGQYFDDPSPYPQPEFSAIENFSGGIPKFASIYNGNKKKFDGTVRIGTEPININPPSIPIGIGHPTEIRPSKTSNLNLVNGVHVDSHVNNHNINVHVPPISFGMVQHGNDFNAHIINHDFSNYKTTPVAHNFIKGYDQRYGEVRPQESSPNVHTLSDHERPPNTNQYNNYQRPAVNNHFDNDQRPNSNGPTNKRTPIHLNDNKRPSVNNQFSGNQRPQINHIPILLNVENESPSIKNQFVDSTLTQKNTYNPYNRFSNEHTSSNNTKYTDGRLQTQILSVPQFHGKDENNRKPIDYAPVRVHSGRPPIGPNYKGNSPNTLPVNRPEFTKQQSSELSEFMVPPPLTSDNQFLNRKPPKGYPDPFKFENNAHNYILNGNTFQENLHTNAYQNNSHVHYETSNIPITNQSFDEVEDYKEDDLENEAGEVIQESNSRPLIPGQIPIEVLRSTTSTTTPHPFYTHQSPSIQSHNYIPHENEILTYKPNIKQPRPFDEPIVRPENQQSNQINHQESNVIIQSGSPNVFANVFDYNKRPQNVYPNGFTSTHIPIGSKPVNNNQQVVTSLPINKQMITTRKPIVVNKFRTTTQPYRVTTSKPVKIDYKSGMDSQTEKSFNNLYTKPVNNQHNSKTTNPIFNFNTEDVTVPKITRRITSTSTTKRPITTTKKSESHFELNIGEIQNINTHLVRNNTKIPMDIELMRPPPLQRHKEILSTPDTNLNPPKMVLPVLQKFNVPNVEQKQIIQETRATTTTPYFAHLPSPAQEITPPKFDFTDIVGMSPPNITTFKTIDKYSTQKPIYSLQVDIPKNEIEITTRRTTNYAFELPATTTSSRLKKPVTRRPTVYRTTTSTKPPLVTTTKQFYWQRPVMPLDYTEIRRNKTRQRPAMPLDYTEIRRNETKPVTLNPIPNPEDSNPIVTNNTDLESQETGLPIDSYNPNNAFTPEIVKDFSPTSSIKETPIFATGTVETVSLEIPPALTSSGVHHSGNEVKIADETTTTHRRRVVTSIFKRPINNKDQMSKTILPTRYITHTKTATVTITKTTVVKSLGAPPSTMTILVTKTEKFTIVDTVTEFHTLVKPTTIAETITTTISPSGTSLYSSDSTYGTYFIKPTNVLPSEIKPTIVVEGISDDEDNDDELEDFIIHDTHVQTQSDELEEHHEDDHHHENESFFVVMTDETKGSVIKIPKITKEPDSRETHHRDEIINNEEVNRVLLGGILIASPPSLETNVLTAQSNKCTPECKASRNELCQRVDGLMRCVCRPGFARMFPDRPCKPTYTYTMKIALNRNGKDKLRYEDALSDSSTPEFSNLASVTHEALDRMVMQSDFRDIYHGVSVHGYEPVTDMDGVVNTFNLQLSDNTDESRLKAVFKKYLRSNNYSLGGTEVYSSKESLDRLQADDFNECSNAQYHDCSEHAHCFNLRGTYTCSCKEGFADLSENILYPGRICSAELIGCERCHYHGTCYSRGDEQIICECFQWYAGDSCQINLKVLLIALITLGAILLVLLLICIIVTCVRGKPQSNITNGMSLLPQRVATLNSRHAGTLDRRAMIHDTSSESGQSDTNTLPYVVKKSVNPKRNAKKMSRVDIENGDNTLNYSDQKDRSLTVMIPRAKYHPAPLTSPHNISSQIISNCDKRKTSIASTNEAKLLSYLDAGPSPKYNKPDSYHDEHGSRKTSGALISAGFEVSATVCANKMGTLATTCGTEADRSENATLIQKISTADLLSCVGTPSQFNTMRQSITDTNGDTMENWLDLAPRIQTISDSRSYDETTIQPPMKSFRNDYDSKSSQHHHEEANTMAERDLGSTFLLPHTHLYKPNRGSDISGFESL